MDYIHFHVPSTVKLGIERWQEIGSILEVKGENSWRAGAVDACRGSPGGGPGDRGLLKLVLLDFCEPRHE
jgi:hypothetical protein